MPILLQINVTANWGSHGRIAEGIGEMAMTHGWESYIAYGRFFNNSRSHLLKIGNRFDQYLHGAKSILFDSHGLGSQSATRRLIGQINEIHPDIIHLHNIHGYYLNYPLLFKFLSEQTIPVVWTFHDAWPITGHCAFPDIAGCERWQTGCFSCPLKSKEYPRSFIMDNSRYNQLKKKESFTSVKNLHIVTVSKWLEGLLRKSILKGCNIQYIYNGIDLDVFSPSKVKLKDNSFFQILGVANIWENRKGLDVFNKLRYLLPDKYKIILVGVTPSQRRRLPQGIEYIDRTDSIRQLVALYQQADVFVNPSVAESFGMTNVEAMACGTPSVVYNNTACSELLSTQTGSVVPLGDIQKMAVEIRRWCELSRTPFVETISENCRRRAVQLFSHTNSYQAYIHLYDILKKGQSLP
jgi:glycosyltransferase involved in cell wall biosynthesis